MSCRRCLVFAVCVSFSVLLAGCGASAGSRLKENDAVHVRSAAANDSSPFSQRLEKDGAAKGGVLVPESPFKVIQGLGEDPSLPNCACLLDVDDTLRDSNRPPVTVNAKHVARSCLLAGCALGIVTGGNTCKADAASCAPSKQAFGFDIFSSSEVSDVARRLGLREADVLARTGRDFVAHHWSKVNAARQLQEKHKFLYTIIFDDNILQSCGECNAFLESCSHMVPSEWLGKPLNNRTQQVFVCDGRAPPPYKKVITKQGAAFGGEYIWVVSRHFSHLFAGNVQKGSMEGFVAEGGLRYGIANDVWVYVRQQLNLALKSTGIDFPDVQDHGLFRDLDSEDLPRDFYQRVDERGPVLMAPITAPSVGDDFFPIFEIKNTNGDIIGVLGRDEAWKRLDEIKRGLQRVP